MALPLACLLVATLPQQPDYTFVEVGAARGILPFPMALGMAAGVAAEDFDGDGDIDLYVPTGAGTPNRLYRNDGTGHFEEVAGALGLASLENHRAALWFDADGDGDLDLALAGDDFGAGGVAAPTSVRLFRQRGDGTFVDRTLQAGLFRQLLPLTNTHVGGLCAGDLNGDGFLDLYLTYWEGYAHLFQNDGHGRFHDVAEASGVRHLLDHWQPVLFDFDDDDDLDVFQAVDFAPNRLWTNQGDGTFVDAAQQAGVANAFNEMGVALGDYDNDGRLDLYVTNISQVGKHNLLYHRREDGFAFDEVAHALHVENSGWGWGTSFLDADNDGWSELMACSAAVASPTRFFSRGAGPQPEFADVADAVGLGGMLGSGLAVFDLDGDGDQDLLQVTSSGVLRLFENTLPAAPERGSLVVRPRMDGANPRAIGALVHVFPVNRPRMTRAILAGSSLLCQEPSEAHFGLGDAPTATVRVRWPDGTVDYYEDVAPNQTLVVRQR